MISLKTITAGLVVPVLALYASLGASAQTAVTLPFEVDFEADEGYSPGSVTSDPAWQFGPGLDASVVTPGASGAQALKILGMDWLWLPTDAQAAQVSWVDFYTKPVFVAPSELPEVIVSEQSAVTAFVKIDSQGEVYAIDGDGAGSGMWTGSGFFTSLDADGESALDWMRLTYRIDYSAKTWDLFIDGQLSLLDLGFLDDTRTSLEEFAILSDPDSGTYLDFFYAGSASPLFTDTSGDGLPDDWLIAHGLNPNLYQRYDDPDFDGLSNIEEFRLGTSPTLADTSGDGLDDGLKVLLGQDPLDSAAGPFGEVPFADGFESDPAGPFVSGTRLWELSGGAAQILHNSHAPEGAQYLLVQGEGAQLSRTFADTQADDAVWIDFQLEVGYHPDSTPPEITAPRAASAFYFGSDGRLRALDGNSQGGGQWLTLDHPPLDEGTWARLTVHHDYAAQTWSVWVDDVRYGQHLGFRDTVPSFTHLQFDRLNALDAITVALTEPPTLDNDGDGLINSLELQIGTDPDNPDSSGNGVSDLLQYLEEMHHPEDPYYFTELASEATWSTGFESFEGFELGALNRQQHWLASPGAEVVAGGYASNQALALDPAAGVAGHSVQARRYFDSQQSSQIWVSFMAQLTPAFPLPDLSSLDPAAAVLLTAIDTDRLAVYDGLSQEWVFGTTAADTSQWVRYDLRLDLDAGTWLACVDGDLLFQNVGFNGDPLESLSRFMAWQDAEAQHPAMIDAIAIGADEPAGLDFSGDGMTNEEKRALGLDPFLNDNSGDGFPDVWKLAHNLDPLEYHDPQLDLDGDGLTLAMEYAFGGDPHASDDRLPGLIVQDRWVNLPGREVADLLNHPQFPASPDDRFYLTKTEIASNQDIDYGTSLRGYIVPPESGEYIFYLASNDDSELWLSPTDSPFDRQRIAYVSGLTQARQFDKYPSQRSAAIYLEAGQHYYFEALHKEDRRSDNLSFAWLRPSANQVEVIEGEHLAYFAPRADDLIGDGLPDAWKLAHGLDPQTGHGIHGAHGDFDGDGLSNLLEYQLGTHPGLADTLGDGVLDGDSVHLFGVSPHEALTPVVQSTHQGATAEVIHGDWAEADGGLYAVEGRGKIAHGLVVQTAGIHDLLLSTSVYAGASSTHAYAYSVWINDVFIERITVPPASGSHQHRLLTPWLEEGEHSLRLELENTLTGRQVSFDAVELSRTGGPDSNASGVPDWMETVLHQRNGIEAATLTSHTSPFSLEGRARYLDLLELDDPALVALPAPDDRFYVDVPLATSAPTELALSFESGGLTDVVSLEWAPLPIDGSNAPLILRQGESLLCVLETSEPLLGPVTYRLDGVQIAESDDPITQLFDTPGSFVLTAAADTAAGPIEHSLDIDVRTADLGEPFYILDSSNRQWVPPLFDDALALEVDGTIVASELEPDEAGDRRFALSGSVPEPRYLAARTHYEIDALGNEVAIGPILDTVPVRTLHVASNEWVHITQEHVFADGTWLVSVGIALNEVPDDISIKVDIFVGGVTFADGSVVQYLTADDFDEYGRAQVQMLKSPESLNSVCHRLHIYLGDTYLGGA